MNCTNQRQIKYYISQRIFFLNSIFDGAPTLKLAQFFPRAYACTSRFSSRLLLLLLHNKRKVNTNSRFKVNQSFRLRLLPLQYYFSPFLMDGTFIFYLLFSPLSFYRFPPLSGSRMHTMCYIVICQRLYKFQRKSSRQTIVLFKRKNLFEGKMENINLLSLSSNESRNKQLVRYWVGFFHFFSCG